MRRIKWFVTGFLKLSAVILLFMSLCGGAFVLFLTGEAVTDLPMWHKSDFLAMPSASTIYDRDGRIVTQLRGKTYRIPVKLERISQVMQDAIVATEDERFYDHNGIDYWGLGRALFNDLRGNSQEGASTITEQLVKNVLLTPEKSVTRKIKEAILARQVEMTYSKQQILELYLNFIYFGEGANGVEAASQTYFGKPASQLTLPESALLAGLPKNPYRFSPFRSPTEARNRRTTVLQVMLRNGYITYDQYRSAADAPLPTKREVPGDCYPYPYFLDHTITELTDKYGFTEDDVYDGGLQIYTTLDQSVQKTLEEVYADPKNFPPSVDKVQPESAMVVLEQSSGAVRGLIGGRKYTVRRGYNRATMLKRQPGSTFKPLVVYSPAIEKGYGPSTILDSSAQSYGATAYTPQNMGNAYLGKITMREALNESVNTYAVRMLSIIGINEGYSFGKRLGLTSLNSQDKVLGLALGGITEGLSPLELASAYTPLANRGVKVETHVINKVTDARGKILLNVKPAPRLVMKQATADMITDMLRTAVENGTGKTAILANHKVAGKTGTTQLPNLPQFKGIPTGNKDAWFAGYTPELVGVVWLGYDNTNASHYLKKIYGGSYPAKIWHAVFSRVLAKVPPSHFAPPPGLMIANERSLQALRASARASSATKVTAKSKVKTNTQASPDKGAAKMAPGAGANQAVPPSAETPKISAKEPGPKQSTPSQTRPGFLNKIFSRFTK